MTVKAISPRAIIGQHVREKELLTPRLPSWFYFRWRTQSRKWKRTKDVHLSLMLRYKITGANGLVFSLHSSFSTIFLLFGALDLTL